MGEGLRQLYTDTIVADIVRKVRAFWQELRWRFQGKPSKVPHIVKERIVLKHARMYRLTALVETGTFKGDMLYACRHVFDRLYSVELSSTFHADAVKRFKRWRHIELYQGDSGDLLPSIIEQLSVPALFWLDAHYSGGNTARAATDTPISREIATVLRHPLGHVILIDDAHEFVGENGYPTIKELRDTVRGFRPDYQIFSEHNIIVVRPGRPA